MLRGKPFSKGVSGNPAGRKPGSKNKFTRLKVRQVQHLLDKRDCNPFEILVDIAMDKSIADRARIKAVEILCQYCGEPLLQSLAKQKLGLENYA